MLDNSSRKLIKLLCGSPVQLHSIPDLYLCLGEYNSESREKEKIKAITKIMTLLWGDGKSAQLLDFFAKFERFLLAIGKRDHFIHQFEVFLLGWFIIHALVKKGFCIEEYMSFSSSVFLQTWLMTAMSHDLGFPLQEEPEIIKVLKELHESLGTKEIATHYAELEKKLSLIGENGREILMKDLLPEKGSPIAHQIIAGIKMTTDINQADYEPLWDELIKSPKNHGVISALILGRELSGYFVPDGNFEDHDNFELNRFRLILAAIALHHLKEESKRSEKAIKNISFTGNPFAYLLYIADNLQEWGRDLGGWTNAPETSLINFEYDYSKITLTFYLFHENWGQDDTEENILAEIKKANRRLGWPTGLNTGDNNFLTIEAQYNSNSKKINGKQIIVEI
jgi:hypothetical protein